eukprot:541979-Hanusia_phi.AAC.1
MAAKRGRGGRAGAAAAAAGRIQPGDPCDEPCARSNQKRARSSETPDKREARLAREAENKVNENSVEREAKLALDRARKAEKTAAETTADREARLQKEAQNRASNKRQRLQDGCFALRTGRGCDRETDEQSIDPAATEETAGPGGGA